MSIADVGVGRLNTSHEVSAGSQLTDIGLVHGLAEIRRVVVCVGNNHVDTDVSAEGRVSAVRRPHDEVVALDELVVQQACREYQPAFTVNVEVVAAVVDIG